MRLAVVVHAISGAALVAGGVGAIALVAPRGRPGPTATAPVARAQPRVKALPLSFVENRGQVDRRASYYLQGSGASVYFTSRGLTLAMSDRRRSGDRWGLRLDFVDARETRPAG